MPSPPHIGVPVDQLWKTMVQNPRFPPPREPEQLFSNGPPQIIHVASPTTSPPTETRTDVVLMVLGICFFVCALLMVIVVAFLHSQTMAVINSQQNMLLYIFQAQIAAANQQQHIMQMMTMQKQKKC